MIYLDGGKATPLKLRALTTLAKALSEAIAGGREQTACKIAEEIGRIGGLHGTTIQNNTFQG